VSYDLVLLPKAEASDDPGAAYERLEEQEEREPSPHEEERLRQLANDLLAANPRNCAAISPYSSVTATLPTTRSSSDCSIRIGMPTTPPRSTASFRRSSTRGSGSGRRNRGGSVSSLDGGANRVNCAKI
jgi:hypothetical protein